MTLEEAELYYGTMNQKLHKAMKWRTPEGGQDVFLDDLQKTTSQEPSLEQ